MTPKSKSIAEEKRIGRGNRHVRGVGQAFAECAQRAARRTEEVTVNPFEAIEEPVRPATDGMIRYAWSLATYREMTEAVRDGMLQMIEDHRAGRIVLDFTIARAFIDRYKDAGQRQRVAKAPSASEVTQDGMYRDPESGQIYKVQFNRASGDGRRLYAKALVIHAEPVRDEGGKITTPAEVSFEYAPGAMRKIRPEWRMSKDEAVRFGALYGTCVRCGRTLTLEASIERAMGSTCSAAKNWS